MASGEVVRKKMKLECILDTFRLNLEDVKGLKSNLECLDEKLSALGLLKIIVCNAAVGYGVPFSKAACATERQCSKLHSFISVFSHGEQIVNSYLENADSFASNERSRNLMSKLLTFLSDNKESEEGLKFDHSYKLTETDWTVRLAQHYFSKLSGSSDYILDKHYHAKKSCCDCGCGESVGEHFGDTSLGNGEGWHGYVDILVGKPETSVLVLEEEPESPDGRRSIEGEKDKMAADPDPDQLLAQTIVFSYLQKKRHPELKHFLIPCIAVSKKEICFYFYDSENDILMESPAFPIFNPDKSLNKLTILATWLVINYKYLCSGITDTMVESDFKADFFKHAREKLSIYQDNLKICCGFETAERSKLEPWFMDCEVTHGKPLIQDGPLQRQTDKGINFARVKNEDGCMASEIPFKMPVEILNDLTVHPSSFLSRGEHPRSVMMFMCKSPWLYSSRSRQYFV